MPPPSRILLVQTQRLGDVVCALPAWRALSSAHPDARIDALVHSPWDSLLSGCSFISNIHTYDRARGARASAGLARAVRLARYNWVIVIHAASTAALICALSGAPRRTTLWRYGSSRAPAWRHLYTEQVMQQRLSGSRHEVEHNLEYLRACGVSAPQIKPQIPLLPGESEEAAEFLVKEGFDLEKPLVFVHPGHGGGRQAWTEQGYAEVVRGLELLGCQVIVSGSAAEAPLAGRIAAQGGARCLAGRTSLRRFCALLARAQLFVSVSTGPMHLASALDVPAVTIHGPADLKIERTRFSPYLSPCEAVESEVVCPCPGSRYCERPVCLEAITPAQVLGACRRLLGAADRL